MQKAENGLIRERLQKIASMRDKAVEEKGNQNQACRAAVLRNQRKSYVDDGFPLLNSHERELEALLTGSREFGGLRIFPDGSVVDAEFVPVPGKYSYLDLCVV
jgi:hypothetical protein